MRIGFYKTEAYCPVLGGACKYVVDGACVAAVCKRMGK